MRWDRFSEMLQVVGVGLHCRSWICRSSVSFENSQVMEVMSICHASALSLMISAVDFSEFIKISLLIIFTC